MAEEADSSMDAKLSAMMPKVRFPYKLVAVKALSDALAQVAQLAGMPYEVALPTEDPMELPVGMLRPLAMIMKAATDFEMPMSLDLSKLVDSTALTVVTGNILKLLKDRDFKKFLAEPAMEDEAASMEEPSEAPMGPADMMARMAGAMKGRK
jgi:hypothetical protein